MPLASAYVSTAVMNPWPTSGPIINSSSQKAREAISSRNSLTTSQRNLREGKEDLLEPGALHIGEPGKRS